MSIKFFTSDKVDPFVLEIKHQKTQANQNPFTSVCSFTSRPITCSVDILSLKVTLGSLNLAHSLLSGFKRDLPVGKSRKF